MEHYAQYAYQTGYSDSAFETSVVPKPMSAPSSTGYATIDDAAVTSTAITMSYSIGLGPVDYMAYGWVIQDVVFHVDNEMTFSFQLSAYMPSDYANLSRGFLQDVTNSVTVLDLAVGDGSGLSATGALHPGIQYSYEAVVSNTIYPRSGLENQFSLAGDASFTVSPVSSVPEPSALALAGLGGLVLAFSNFRRRRAAIAH